MGNVIEFPTPNRPDPKKHGRLAMAIYGIPAIIISLLNWAATLFGFVIGTVIVLSHAVWAFIKIFYIFVESTIMLVVLVVIIAMLV